MISEERFPRKGSENLVITIGIPSFKRSGRWFPSATWYRKGNQQFADVVIQENEKNALCHLLAERILSDYQPELMRKIVNKRYFYFTDAEKTEILLASENYQKNDVWRKMLEQQLERFLQTNRFLHLEGFVNFRMREYLCELEYATDQAAEDYLIGREYQEFINMLIDLTDIQPSLTKLVHLKKGDTGEYVICDEQYRPVVLQEFASEDHRMSREDRLLSRLIMLSPEKIVIHRKYKIENKELINTILNVFGEKVTYCDDCPYCR